MCESGVYMENMISIIVPIYNVKSYLRQCLDSICAQTYRKFEVILVDDGSTDSCGRICDDYSKLDNRFKVIHKKNGGLMSAWKKGLEYANSNLIMFVDSDDWVEKNTLEILYKEYLKTKADIICCSFLHSFKDREIPDDHKVKPGYYDKKRIKNDIFPVLINDGTPLSRGIRICRWAKLIKKELITRNLFWTNEKITIGEDLNIMFPVIVEANSIVVLPKTYLYHYRANDASIMKKVSLDMFSKVELLYEKEMEIANFYKGIYDFTCQIEMDFCDLSIYIFMKEYIQNNLFENFKVARQSKYYKILKKKMNIFRYKKSDRILAVAFKVNKLFSFILLCLLRLRNRSKR